MTHLDTLVTPLQHPPPPSTVPLYVSHKDKKAAAVPAEWGKPVPHHHNISSATEINHLISLVLVRSLGHVREC